MAKSLNDLAGRCFQAFKILMTVTNDEVNAALFRLGTVNVDPVYRSRIADKL